MKCRLSSPYPIAIPTLPGLVHRGYKSLFFPILENNDFLCQINEKRLPGVITTISHPIVLKKGKPVQEIKGHEESAASGMLEGLKSILTMIQHDRIAVLVVRISVNMEWHSGVSSVIVMILQNHESLEVGCHCVYKVRYFI
jgi:hypothetical protein